MDFESSTEIQMHKVGEDVQTMIDGRLSKLGINQKLNCDWRPSSSPPDDVIDAKNSGTTFTFSYGTGCFCRHPLSSLMSDASLRAKPMKNS